MYSLTSNENGVCRHGSTHSTLFSWRRFRRQLLHIDSAEADFARRHFRWKDNQARQRLERVGATFLLGYNSAIEESDPSILARQVNEVDQELRGFAFEGAAMGLTLLDSLTPWNRGRFLEFSTGPAAHHVYMVHVGAGWAIARLPWLRWNLKKHLQRLDPLLRWLALDGYGFHEGYFNWSQYVEAQQLPRGLSAYGLRAFDQGLGRSLWFVEGADVDRIPLTIKQFPLYRRADLWSGIGLACAYAGGASSSAIQTIYNTAVPYAGHLAQGAAFAAKARQTAGNESEHTDLACRIFAGLSATQAAAITDEALKDLPRDLPQGAKQPEYEVWRERIRTRLSKRNYS
jgi:hypothetical protein